MGPRRGCPAWSCGAVAGYLAVKRLPQLALRKRPRTFVARRVDVGDCAHGSSMPRRKRRSGTGGMREKPDTKTEFLVVIEFWAPRGPYRLLNAAAARLAAFR